MKQLLLFALPFSIYAMEEQDLSQALLNFNGKIGIYARTINTNPNATSIEISINAHEFFPMASVLKIPFACFIFDAIDQPYFTLKDRIKITHQDLVLGSGTIKNEVTEEQAKSYSIKDLLERILCESDNTATHRLMTICGGHADVDAWLEKNNIKDIHFRTTEPEWLESHIFKTLQYKATQDAVLNSPQASFVLKETARALADKPQPTTINFSNETTNIATPKALTDFLIRCYQGTAPGLSTQSHRDLLLALMNKYELGKNCIPKYMTSAIVRHKAGSGIVGICNDAGIIEIPDKNPIAITIFIKDSVQPIPELEEVIAKITQIICEKL